MPPPLGSPGGVTALEQGLESEANSGKRGRVSLSAGHSELSHQNSLRFPTTQASKAPLSGKHAHSHRHCKQDVSFPGSSPGLQLTSCKEPAPGPKSTSLSPWSGFWPDLTRRMFCVPKAGTSHPQSHPQPRKSQHYSSAAVKHLPVKA